MTKPFEQWTGSEFLLLYAALFAVASVAAAVARWAVLRTPTDEPDPPEPVLSPYEVAYLAGGRELSADAALANLVGRGDLVVNAAHRSVAAKRDLDPGSHPLEHAVAQNPYPGRAGPWSISAARRSARTALAETHVRLVDLGLVVADSPAWAARMASAFPFFALLTLGLVRLRFGLAQGKPVTFLIIACVATAAVGSFLLAIRPHRSRRGNRLLEELRREHASLRDAKSLGSADSSGSDLVLAVGLFGTTVLAGGALADLYIALMPPSTSSESNAGGNSGGDGGGGCGGGCGG